MVDTKKLRVKKCERLPAEFDSISEVYSLPTGTFRKSGAARFRPRRFSHSDKNASDL